MFRRSREIFQLVMHPLHKTMKVHPQPLCLGKTFVEEVHEHGLAPTNTTPQIKPLQRHRGSDQKSSQHVFQVWPRPLPQRVEKPIEQLNHRSLCGISREAWLHKQRFVAFEWRHGGAL